MADAGDFSLKDSKEFFNIYASEFNRPELHDRVLVLDVFEDNFLNEFSSKTSRIDHEVKSDLRLTSEVEKDEPMTTSSDSPSMETNAEETESKTHATNMNTSVEKSDLVVLQRKRARCDGKTTEMASGVKVARVGPHVSTLEGQGHCVNEHKLFVHLWLAVHSNYFRTLFLSGLKEVHIKVPQSEEMAHLHLIEAMYRPDLLNNLTVSEVCSVLLLANKYEAIVVFRKCKYVLKSKVHSIEVCEKLFIQLVKGNHQLIESLEDLIKTMENFVVKRFCPLDSNWKTSYFEDLSEDLLRLLLSSSALVASCEDVVFHALMHWITQYTQHRVVYERNMTSFMYLKSSSLLSVVRFEKLTTSYLLSVVQHDPIAKQLENFSDYYMKGINYSALPTQVRGALVNKPKERALGKADIVQIQWNMPEKGVLSTVTRLQSRPFWACGFRMKLCLRRRYQDGNNYYVKISLQLLDLREDGFTSFYWKVKHQGKCVVSESVLDQDFVFTAKNPMSHGKKGSFLWIGTDNCVLDLVMRPCPTVVFKG